MSTGARRRLRRGERVPVHPKRSSNHLLPANAEVGPSIDEVSDSDQFLHAAIRLKRYKVSHCSKTEGGADAFTSVLRTLAGKGGGQSVVDGLCGVFSAAPVPVRSA